MYSRNMKKIIVGIIVSVLFVIFGCAKDPELPSADLKSYSFQQWMEEYAPNAVPLPMNDDVYIEFKYRNPEPWPDSLIPRLYSWFTIDYTGYTLDGRVFVSRQSEIIRRCGTWKRTTHFGDEFSQWYPDGGIWCTGLLEAMTILHRNDSARIYISVPFAYPEDTMKRNVGTAGETSKYVGYPVYFDVRFKECLNYPTIYWRDSLIRFVEEKWGQKAEDSIFVGCYMRKLVENPNGYQIDTDSSVYVHYKQAFMDNHLIYSDNDSVNYVAGTYNAEKSYYPINKVCGSTTDAYQDFYNRLLPYMRKGETAEFAMIAGWAPQGKEGDPMGVPQLLPYENSILTLYTYDDSVWSDTTILTE